MIRRENERKMNCWTYNKKPLREQKIVFSHTLYKFMYMISKKYEMRGWKNEGFIFDYGLGKITWKIIKYSFINLNHK